ncbi:NAD(P)-binding protein [Paraburkholderia rhynchosiae]
MSNSNSSTTTPIDVAIIGGGQSALAVAYFLRRAGIRYVVLDDQPAPGGAWQMHGIRFASFLLPSGVHCRAG